MPFVKLNFRPGVNRVQTSYSGEGGWYECDKVRFFSGYPQKLGGWAKYSPNFFFGTCRQLFNWITSFSDNFLALGTNNHVYIETGGQYYNITPLRTTTTNTATFAATNGSSTITVTDNAHGADTGDFVTFSGAVSLGGNITAAVLNQDYEITRTGVNTYTIQARSSDNKDQIVLITANSSDSGNGGGAVTAKYGIASGYASDTYGYGWGASAWNGSYAWGLGGSTPINLEQRDWWFDNFDNDLVMNIRSGKIYYWERGSLTNPETALSTRAVLLSSLSGVS